MKTIKFNTKILFAGLALLFTSGCMTQTFTVTSEPPQADVYYQPPGATEKRTIGKTPISMPMKDLKAIIGETASSGQYFPVTVEKTGYNSETLQIPASRFGTLVTALDVKLKEGVVAKEEKTAKVLIDHLFLAQKYAVTLQFERAQIEIDKILADFPTFPRALSMRASIFYAQKNYNESLKWYEAALKVDPNMDDAVKMAAKIRNIQSGREPASVPAKAGAGIGTGTGSKQ